MKILVLSGEVTSQRPISYGFPHAWDCTTVSLLDPEHTALIEKYGDATAISSAEVVCFLKRGYDRALTLLTCPEDLDAVVGIGHGAHVLMNLNTSHEWRGPSIYVMSEGPARYNFVPRPLLDEIDCDVQPISSVWISVSSERTNDTRRRYGSSGRKCVYERDSSVSVSLVHQNWEHNLYASGLLRTCVELAIQT